MMNMSATTQANLNMQAHIDAMPEFVRHIDRLINASSLTQKEIAAALNYPKPNIITMFKQGTTRVPVDKVPALALALGVEPHDLVVMWLRDYAPALLEVIEKNLAPTMSGQEKTWIKGLRKIYPTGVPKFSEGHESLLREHAASNA